MYHLLHSLTSASIIKTLSTWFNLFGWPSSIRSDGGPQFRGEFSRFCASHAIRHEVSAPYNPNLTAWPKLASSPLKTFYANVLLLTPMLTLYYMSGGTCRVLTATAQPSLCSVVLSEHPSLPCPRRMLRLIFFLQHLQRMLPNREQKYITIDRSFLGPSSLLARQCTFKTLSLLRGTDKASLSL